jgi:hypothetical protein
MKTIPLPARFVVAAALILFAWKGGSVGVVWPPVSPSGPVSPNAPAPDPALLKWAEPLRKHLPTMLPADREYYSRFYDALSFVLLRNSKLEKPVIKTTSDFEAFHASSLQMSIDKASVGKYPGLDAAIDEVFVTAAGPEVKPVTPDVGAKLIAASQVISWVFGIRGNE